MYNNSLTIIKGIIPCRKIVCKSANGHILAQSMYLKITAFTAACTQDIFLLKIPPCMYPGANTTPLEFTTSYNASDVVD
jgi:hypothetical protein